MAALQWWMVPGVDSEVAKLVYMADRPAGAHTVLGGETKWLPAI